MLVFKQRLRPWGVLLFVVFLTIIIGGIFVPSTQAANIVVNVSYDSLSNPDSNPGVMNPNDCSLREAIQNANDDAATYNDCPAGSGADIITFTVGTIVFDSSISVVTDIQLNGPVIFDGNNLTHMFVAGSSGNGVLRIDEVTLRNGDNTSGGAVVMQGGGLVCTESRFEDNRASVAGGAISGDGPLDLNGCFFERNSASTDGGAISYNGSDPGSIIGTIFRDNTTGSDGGGSGGAIYTTATMAITGSVFDSNTADVGDQDGIGGGAIFHGSVNISGMVITASVFGGNEVNGEDGRGGAVFSNGNSLLSINYSHFGTTPLPLPAPFNTATAPNRVNGATGLGGAVFVNGATQILGTSFIGNTSANHGGAFSYGSGGDDIVIANSTFSGNTAANNGGAIYNPVNDSLVTLSFVTIANNTAGTSGGGIFNVGDGDNGGTDADEIFLRSSIVYNNSAANASNCGGGTLSSEGTNNVIPAGECANAGGVNGDPALGSAELTFSVGSVVTYALPLGGSSAALGTGDATLCSSFPILNVDQRIFPRPQGGGSCDAGAYESSNPSATATPTPSSTPTATLTASATATATATATASSTPTASATATASTTPTASATTSATPSSTASVTASATPSSTASATTSATPSSTASATTSATPSSTASATASATPSSTASATTSATPSSTASSTASTTPSSTATTAVETATPTSTASATATTAVETATPTATASATATTAVETATPTSTASATATTAVETSTPTSTATTVLETATPTATLTASATLDPSITVTATIEVTSTPNPNDGGTQPNAEVFLCDNLASQSNEAMIAFGGSNNVVRNDIYGNVFCRIIVKDSQVITKLAEIGVLSVIQSGVIQAVDMFGLLPDGSPVVPFINPMTICLRGVGSAIFLSAENSLRSPLLIPISPNSPAGYSCGSIPVSGTVVLVRNAMTDTQSQPAADPSTGSVALVNCQVLTNNPVNFRSSPSIMNATNILELLPYQTILTATERIPEWYGVIRNGVLGWVSAEFVDPIGTC